MLPGEITGLMGGLPLVCLSDSCILAISAASAVDARILLRDGDEALDKSLLPLGTRSRT